MSTPEYQPAEQKSSVAISMNAKGEAIPTVKCYAGTTDAEMTELRSLSVAHYLATVAAVRR